VLTRVSIGIAGTAIVWQDACRPDPLPTNGSGTGKPSSQQSVG